MLDSDDYLFPSALATYDRVVRTFDSPPVIFGSMISFQDRSSIPAEAKAPCHVEVLKYQDFLSKTISLAHINSGFTIRKSVFDEVGGFRNSTPQTFHLDDLHIKLKVGTYGPFIAVQKPYIVAYRMHEGNSIRNFKAITNGILAIARSERQGEYPGGTRRLWDRYAALGELALKYALFSWRQGQRKLALRLLLGTAPMAFAAMWKKYLRYFRKPAQPIVLPE